MTYGRGDVQEIRCRGRATMVSRRQERTDSFLAMSFGTGNPAGLLKNGKSARYLVKNQEISKNRKIHQLIRRSENQ